VATLKKQTKEAMGMNEIKIFFDELSKETGLPVPLLIELVLEMARDGRLPIIH